MFVTTFSPGLSSYDRAHFNYFMMLFLWSTCATCLHKIIIKTTNGMISNAFWSSLFDGDASSSARPCYRNYHVCSSSRKGFIPEFPSLWHARRRVTERCIALSEVERTQGNRCLFCYLFSSQSLAQSPRMMRTGRSFWCQTLIIRLVVRSTKVLPATSSCAKEMAFPRPSPISSFCMPDFVHDQSSAGTKQQEQTRMQLPRKADVVSYPSCSYSLVIFLSTFL